MKKSLLALASAALLMLAALLAANFSSGSAAQSLPGEAPGHSVPRAGVPAEQFPACKAAPPGTPEAREPGELDLLQTVRGQHVRPLEGTIFDEPSSTGREWFANAYRRLNAQHARSTGPMPVSPPDDAWQLSQPGPLQGAAAMAASLRQAARQLETTAADLEEQQDYQRADRLRDWARRLRAQARNSP